MEFGQYARTLREQRQGINGRYSVRQIAYRIGVDPKCLSKIERGEMLPPTEEVVLRLATELGEDADLLLARAGMIASDIREIIIRRPVLFAELIRGLGEMSDDQLETLVRKVRNGEC